MKIIRLLSVLTMVSLLFGCGLTVRQKKLLAEYSSAAGIVGANSAVEFKAMQDLVVQANRGEITINGMETYTQLEGVKGTLTDENISQRVRATKALKSYAELLSQLVGKSEKETLNKAVNEAFKGANEFAPNIISSDVRKTVQTAITAIGGLFLEKRKAEAVREVILGYKGLVDGLCDALVSDFSRDGGGLRQVRLDPIFRPPA